MQTIPELLNAGTGTLSEHDSKQVLAAYGIPVTGEKIAHTESDADSYLSTDTPTYACAHVCSKPVTNPCAFACAHAGSFTAAESHTKPPALVGPNAFALTSANACAFAATDASANTPAHATSVTRTLA